MQAILMDVPCERLGPIVYPGAEIFRHGVQRLRLAANYLAAIKLICVRLWCNAY